VTEMDDGWVEGHVVHKPIVRTRFEKTPSPAERDKVDSQWPNISGGTHSLPPFPFQSAFKDSRSFPTPLNDPPKSPSF